MKQPPSIVGQLISFQLNEYIQANNIVIVGNKDAIELWEKYFKVLER